MSDDARLHFPATERNRAPILERLRPLLSADMRVLEIASGSGEHIVHFAEAVPDAVFQPSDLEVEHVASIDAWVSHLGLENVRPARLVDTTESDWSADLRPIDVILCANMIHIAPIAACEGLLAGAGRLLEPGGGLVLYGPFLESDVETAPSNLSFDESLRSRDPAWGIRSLDRVDALAETNGLTRSARHAMPANNLLLEYRRG